MSIKYLYCVCPIFEPASIGAGPDRHPECSQTNCLLLRQGESLLAKNSCHLCQSITWFSTNVKCSMPIDCLMWTFSRVWYTEVGWKSNTSPWADVWVSVRQSVLFHIRDEWNIQSRSMTHWTNIIHIHLSIFTIICIKHKRNPIYIYIYIYIYILGEREREGEGERGIKSITYNIVEPFFLENVYL